MPSHARYLRLSMAARWAVQRVAWSGDVVLLWPVRRTPSPFLRALASLRWPTANVRAMTFSGNSRCASGGKDRRLLGAYSETRYDVGMFPAFAAIPPYPHCVYRNGAECKVYLLFLQLSSTLNYIYTLLPDSHFLEQFVPSFRLLQRPPIYIYNSIHQ